MNAASLPHLTAYIGALPDGLASFPDHQQKASTVRPLLDAAQLGQVPPGTPDALADLLESPPPPSVWIPEVHANALWLVVFDTNFNGDAQAFFDFSMRVNRGILSQGFYKTIMRLVGPAMSARAVSAAWGAFHRGIAQQYTRTEAGAEVSLHYPPQLIPEPLGPSYATAYAAALELSGTRIRRAEMTAYSPTRLDFVLEW